MLTATRETFACGVAIFPEVTGLPWLPARVAFTSRPHRSLAQTSRMGWNDRSILVAGRIFLGRSFAPNSASCRESLSMRFVFRAWDTFIGRSLRAFRDEQQVGAQDPGALRVACAVLAFAGVMLVFREEQYRPSLTYWLDALVGSNLFPEELATRFRDWCNQRQNYSLSRLCYWSIWQFLTYVVGPALFVKIALRHRLRDYGVKLRGATSCWWAYLGMYLVILPFVLWMAREASFQHTYPFFKPTDVGLGALDANGAPTTVYWKRFWVWEIFYALQFLSLEFFFRGFMLHGTRRALGIGSVYVMMIPYCMIHFGKPLPETLGALIAGLVLGFMSLKTRSIWLGAASHISVALTMDFSALAALAVSIK